MIGKLLLVAPLLVSSVTAHPATLISKRAGDISLADWSSQSPPLESYWRFKNRYNSLGCGNQQGSDFYTNCCYPLTADESLSSRPAECTPSSLTCGGNVSVQSVVTSSNAPASAPAPTYSSESQDNNDYDYDDDSDLPICEDPNDDGEWHDDTSVYTDPSVPSSSSDAATPAATDTGNSGNTENSGNTGNTDNTNTGSTPYGDLHQGGHATYYYQGGNAGACGDYHGDGDYIGAIDSFYYGDLGQKSDWCGKRVRITNTNNQQSVEIVIADVCPSCDGDQGFDLSVAAFQAIAPLSDGYVPIQVIFFSINLLSFLPIYLVATHLTDQPSWTFHPSPSSLPSYHYLANPFGLFCLMCARRGHRWPGFFSCMTGGLTPPLDCGVSSLWSTL
ncbi:hypothetical protein FRC14_004425 [Serendipita sp. 396]|nr:hypothetical protein FRC14_004425 [Serendipita sp. 396]